MLSDKVKRSIEDLRYLLDRGYNRSPAVEFVSDHLLLELQQRHLLARCVFSEEESEDHKDRIVGGGEARNRKIGIDGYNVLITVESILNGERVIKCDDGFVRDLQAVFGKYKMSEGTEVAIDRILQLLEEIEPRSFVFLFDRQVSHSGELSGMARGMIDDLGLEGDARTAVGTDAKVRDFDVSASSDRGIIKKSERVLDIPREILEEEGGKVIDLESL